MTGWYAQRMPRRSAKGLIALTLLALLLVAAVPVALMAAVILMLVGHVVGGLSLFGGSVIVAALVVTIAGMSGMRHLRKLVTGSGFRDAWLTGAPHSDAAEPQDTSYANVVQLDRSEYTDLG
jgi:hypothetical protein